MLTWLVVLVPIAAFSATSNVLEMFIVPPVIAFVMVRGCMAEETVTVLAVPAGSDVMAPTVTN